MSSAASRSDCGAHRFRRFRRRLVPSSSLPTPAATRPALPTWWGGEVPLQRDVAVLPNGAFDGLALAELQPPDQRTAGLGWLDHIVDVAALGGDVRVGEPGGVLGDELLAPGGGIRCSGEVSLVHDVDGSFRAHDRD